MGSTTDFEQWLVDNAPESHEEAFDLGDASQGTSSGIYSVKSSENGQLFISRDGGDDTLALVSAKAVDAFAELVKAYNPYPDLGWDGARVYHDGMKKD
ncbi:MAG: hypothetical protein AXW12_01140 [Thalassospira sp. Nap_22]|nr:MAG: hypothetical protein AXW12_01140 [Thalassospira sp. Nap_22]